MTVRRLRGAWGILLLASGVSVFSSACYFRTLIAAIGIQPGGYPYYVDQYMVTFEAGTLLADCTFDDDFFKLGCIYTITDENGFLVDLTSTAQLVADYGLVGAFIDPVVLQVPGGISGATGTAKTGPVPVPLVITEATSFKAGPHTTVTAEPGQKFLIVELPTGLANTVSATDPQEGQAFDFTLQFTGSELPIPVKVMFTVRVDSPAESYYLPMLPCTTRFGDVPGMSIGFATATNAEADVLAMVDGYAAMACEDEVYDLRTAPGPSEPGEHRVMVPALASD